VSWHGMRAWAADWSPGSRLLAMMRSGRRADGDVDHVYLAANAHWEGHTVELPGLPPGLRWHLFADTSAPAPGDVAVAGNEPSLVDQSSIPVGPRSVVVLVAHRSA
jgi:isoamylase